MTSLTSVSSESGADSPSVNERPRRWQTVPRNLALAVEALEAELTRRRGSRPQSAAWEYELWVHARQAVDDALRGKVAAFDDGALKQSLADDADLRRTLTSLVFVRASILWPLSLLVYAEDVEEIHRISGEWLVNDGNDTRSLSGTPPREFSGLNTRDEDEHIERWLRDSVFGLPDVHGNAHFTADAPLAEATLPTVHGPVRFAAAMAPAVSGWSRLALTVRVPRSNAPQSLEEFESVGTLTAGTKAFIEALVRSRCNILICGDTGMGKTALLRACCKAIDADEVIVSIEDRAELLLNVPGRDGTVFHRRTIALDTVSGAWKGATVPVTMEDQVRHALRHRPRRFVLGEARGGEMFDVCHAMMSGHAGSMVTIHATTAAEAVRRAELLVAQSPMARGQYDAAERLVRAVIHVCVHLTRDETTGRRVVDEIVAYSAEGGLVTVYATEDGRLRRMCGADLSELPSRVGGPLRRYLKEIPTP